MKRTEVRGTNTTRSRESSSGSLLKQEEKKNEGRITKSCLCRFQKTEKKRRQEERTGSNFFAKASSAGAAEKTRNRIMKKTNRRAIKVKITF